MNLSSEDLNTVYALLDEPEQCQLGITNAKELREKYPTLMDLYEVQEKATNQYKTMLALLMEQESEIK